MANGTHAGVLLVALTAGLAGCGGWDSSQPTAPTTPLAARVARIEHGPVLADVTLSGFVYEVTRAGRVPLSGAVVYCEPCGVETHSWAESGANGFYSFTGVWTYGDSVPTVIWAGKDGYTDPPGTPRPSWPDPKNPGWHEVWVNGNTQFDIELVKQ